MLYISEIRVFGWKQLDQIENFIKTSNVYTYTIKSFLYSKNMMFILGDHLGPYHIWFFIIGQSLMFLIDKEDTFLWMPILWQWNWFFFLIFETHLLVFLHDMILVAVININILHSVNISLEILWIFTAVFIFFLFQTCLLNFHVNGQPRMKA